MCTLMKEKKKVWFPLQYYITGTAKENIHMWLDFLEARGEWETEQLPAGLKQTERKMRKKRGGTTQSCQRGCESDGRKHSHDVAFNFNRLLVGRFQIQMLSAKELRDYNVGIGISPPTVSHILKSKPTWINGSETL